MANFVRKYELAVAYFPDVKPETASKLLSKQITCNTPLLAALQATGYDHRTARRFSPLQLQIIYRFLGEP